jgi:hypothetical protein
MTLIIERYLGSTTAAACGKSEMLTWPINNNGVPARATPVTAPRWQQKAFDGIAFNPGNMRHQADFLTTVARLTSIE